MLITILHRTTDHARRTLLQSTHVGYVNRSEHHPACVPNRSSPRVTQNNILLQVYTSFLLMVTMERAHCFDLAVNDCDDRNTD